MNKKIMAFIGFFVCAAGITTWIMLQNFDVRGFSLSERESMLSISGQSTSFLFEVKPGDYEFILHRYQFGEQVSEQAFLNGRGPMVEDDLFEGIRIYNRALMVISLSHVSDGVMRLDVNLEGSIITGVEEIGLQEMMTFSWQSIERRVRLGDEKIPLFYLARTDGFFPFSLENIVAPGFELGNTLEEFRDIPELFIVSVRKIS